MMVDLLTRDTTMKVAQASEGMPLERNCVYVIPPQAYLSVRDGVLRLTQPQGAARRASALRFLREFAGGRLW
jgi:two-component system CheB/CheR fusion protein